jgi:tetratricopeptide (TPR) repeat protein
MVTSRTVSVAVLMAVGLMVGALAAAQDVDPLVAPLATVDAKLTVYATKDARDAVNPIADKAETDARVAVALGRVLDQEKKYDDAIVKLAKAVALAPDNGRYLLALGETYLHKKDQTNADATFQKLADLVQPRVDADATAWEPRYLLAIARMRLKQFDKATPAFTKALELTPGHPMTLYYFGLSRALEGKWADAVDQLSKAIDKDPTIAMAYYYRALAYDKLKKKDKLVLDMRTFVQLAPDAPEAERARAVLDAAKR